MTFNEFRQLAENPPRKEEPTIFKVAVYGIDTLEMEEGSKAIIIKTIIEVQWLARVPGKDHDFQKI